MKNEAIKSIIDQHFDSIFKSIADEFNLQNGDITVEQSLRLDDIQEQLFSLVKTFVRQNNPKSTKVKLVKIAETKNPFGVKYCVYYAIINDSHTLQFSFTKTSDRLGILYHTEFPNLVRDFRSLSEIKETIKSLWTYLSEFAWQTDSKKF